MFQAASFIAAAPCVRDCSGILCERGRGRGRGTGTGIGNGNWEREREVGTGAGAGTGRNLGSGAEMERAKIQRKARRLSRNAQKN